MARSPVKKRAKPSIAARRVRFLDRLRRTANVARAAREAGISTSALYQHRARHAGFAGDWDAAIGEALDELEDVLIERAKHGVERPVYYAGKQVGSVRNYSDSLAMFILKAKRPEVYSRLAAAGADSDLADDDARAEVLRRIERLAGDEG